MRLILTVLFLGLCGSIYANQAVFTELSQINDNPFGATVLAAISANLRAKTPIEDISVLLQEILNDLLAESAALDQSYNSRKQSLSNTIETSSGLITSYQSSIDSLTTSVQTDTASRNSKETTVGNLQSSISTTQTALDQLISNHQSYLSNVDADIEDLESAIDACERALAKMNTYQSATATSLLQVASSAQKELQSFSKELDGMRTKLSKHGSVYGPLIHELVALTENPESGKAAKVIQLLTELLALLRKALADLEGQKSSTISGYNLQRSQLEADLTSYKGQVTILNNDIIDLNTRISQAKQNIETLVGLRTEAENVRAKAQSDLSELEGHYGTERPKYDKLIAIMRNLIQHFSENVASVDDWTKQQVNGF